MVFKSYRTTCLHQQKTSNLLPHAKCLNLQVQEIAENLDISITFEEKSMKKKSASVGLEVSKSACMSVLPLARSRSSGEPRRPRNVLRKNVVSGCQWLPFWNCHWAFTASWFPSFSSVRIHVRLHRNSTAGLCCTQQLRSSSRQRDLKPYFFLS